MQLANGRFVFAIGLSHSTSRSWSNRQPRTKPLRSVTRGPNRRELGISGHRVGRDFARIFKLLAVRRRPCDFRQHDGVKEEDNLQSG